MCHSKTESLNFYKYLCLKIGSKEVIRARRLLYLCRDLRTNKLSPQITSGSKAEWLHLKGSDHDVMYVCTNFVVYESEKDGVQNDKRIVFIMDTEYTPPCFTHLRLCVNCKWSCLCLNHLLQHHRREKKISSELCNSDALYVMTSFFRSKTKYNSWSLLIRLWWSIRCCTLFLKNVINGYPNHNLGSIDRVQYGLHLNLFLK